MKYTKRFELIHLLGGKCSWCGNENFFDLDIDHKFNDGDGDRKMYKDVEGHYLSRPTRAKERLQVLCKTCHIYKHKCGFKSKQEIDDYLKEQDAMIKRSQEYSLVVSTLKRLQGDLHQPVSLTELIATLGIRDNDDWQLKWYNIIKHVERNGEIYESKPRCYNTV